ncbi:ABC transporter permease [Vibrio gallicus]|uniref:ABC transporter permease n=1 Tax=Vibrio gallicus TaxID=190897 RepID=UPI0021C3E3EE|nr:ABC transporter permease [Vibrio gallicus]
MQSSIDIDWWLLALFSLTLAGPFAINRYFGLRLGKDTAISILRMTIQLLLIGLYLEYLFEVNNPWINLVWLVVMIGVGASAIVGKAKLPKQVLLLPVAIGLTLGLTPILLVLCGLVIQPVPFYSTQYMIPLAGMLLGNCLSSNIIALQNLYGALNERKSEYEAAIALAAPIPYATRPFVQHAMRKAFAPSLASMSTMGLVTLPGMMTGQILGGVSPMIAIKYQLIIMIAIFVVMNLSVTISLQLSLKQAITKQGRIVVSCGE